MKLFAMSLLLVEMTANALTIPSTQACYKHLSANYSQDSKAFRINVDEFYYADQEHPQWQEIYAVQTVAAALKDCSSVEEEIKLNNVTCQDIGSFGNVCYFEAAAGFFYITKDQVDGAQVIFNRFD